jgi:hypothetical protein
MEVANIQWLILDTFQWPKMGKFEWAITIKETANKILKDISDFFSFNTHTHVRKITLITR